jgi:hypothetical protein
MANAKLIKYLFDNLKDVQKEMFHNYFKSTGRKYVIHSARRLGKTHLLIVLSCIVAYSKSNAQIRYASVTQKSVRKMIHPIFKMIFKEVNEAYRPKWNQQEGAYTFPNNSQIHVAGVNAGHADDLRGTGADLCVVDEAAFIDELRYLVDSVLVPQLLTTGGKLVMASSSPFSPAHEFATYIQEAILNSNYSSYDITQGGYPDHIVQEFITEAGGIDSTTCQREYFNKLVVDSRYAIVPEFKSALVKSYAPGEFDSYYHRYVGMDIGTKDLTAIIFGIYNFHEARLYITDEIIIEGEKVTTANISALVKEKELELKFPPYRRVSDNNNLILLQDLGSGHDMHFIPTSKDSLHAMVNELRLWVQNERIYIDPTCLHVLGCLEFGVWDKDRKAWGRSAIYKHFDALAALMYLVRNIDQNTNPIPSGYGTNRWTHIRPEDDLQNDNFNKIFNLR